MRATLPQTASGVELTADLLARTIIAAAAVYGDDPVQAFQPRRGRDKRCLAPAIIGVRSATGASGNRLRAILKVSSSMPVTGDDRFDKAQRAAEAAARYAMWRPDAAATVAEPPAPALRLVESGPKPFERPAPAGPIYRPPVVVAAPAPKPAAAPARPTFTAAPITPDSPLRDRILDALTGRRLTAKSLASILGAKELYVSQTLTTLAHELLVDADDPPPPAGRDTMEWFLIRRAEA